MTTKILSVSDYLVPFIYSPTIRQRFPDVTFVVSCGDLPYYYLDYIISILDVPLYFVRGNHDQETRPGDLHVKSSPDGGTNLHNRVLRYRNVLLAGIEGSIRYREGPFMYTQTEMWMNVFNLVPSMLLNKMLYGRFLDIFVTHAPAWGIYDQTDLPHQGIKAFRWLVLVFQPIYHFYGHIHVYRTNEEKETKLGETRLINSYGFRETYL
jgi:Icc-related predicted phosphoesterase